MNEETDRGQLDEEVKALLRARIESFEQLETLLLLHRDREGTWSPRAVAERLNIPQAAAEAALEHLDRNDLIEVQVGNAAGRFAYNPGNPTLAEAVDRLSRAYHESRLEIMKLMSANAIERVRTQALRVFADAFVLGRKKDG